MTSEERNAVNKFISNRYLSFSELNDLKDKGFLLFEDGRFMLNKKSKEITKLIR